jgi:thymidylate synthase (FAD)
MDPIVLLAPTSTNLSEVKLVDVMGSDQAICEAARLSYSATAKKPMSSDRDLLRYLLNHSHTSPFEMAELKFYLRMTIFTARQWIRHRTASLNEVSGRYSVMPSEFYVPEEFHFQSVANKQGSGGKLDRVDNAEVRHMVSHQNLSAFELYESMVKDADPLAGVEPSEGGQDYGWGIAKEEARMHLPLSTYTEIVWKIDLHNLMHFMRLRVDSHAQPDIRLLANAIMRGVADLFPLAYEAWVDYQRDAVKLSRMEIAFLRDLMSVQDRGLVTDLLSQWQNDHEIGSREMGAFRDKLGIS